MKDALLRVLRLWPYLLAAIALTALARAAMGRNLGGDFLCFWTAARLLASGGNPYDPASQIEIQHAIGWDRLKMGFGIWDFLPFNYPPWIEAFAIPLLPLGYHGAKVAWVGIGFFALLIAARAARAENDRIPKWGVATAFVLFLPSTISACQGQTSPLLFCTLAVAVWALREHRENVAGIALAWSTLKPHLALIPVACALLWAARQQRWRVIGAFGIALAVLSVVSFAVIPNWPLKMLAAIRYSPVPTESFPELGGTWPLLLRTLGMSGFPLYLVWAALALPAVLLTARIAWKRGSQPADVLSAAILATFIVLPYGRIYDYALLLLPILALSQHRRGGLVLFAFVSATWMYLGIFSSLNTRTDLPGTQLKLYTFFWIPAVVAIAWVAMWRNRNSKREEAR